MSGNLKGFSSYLSLSDMLTQLVLMLLVLVALALGQMRYEAANPAQVYDKKGEEYFVNVDVLRKDKPETAPGGFAPGESAWFLAIGKGGELTLTNRQGHSERLGSEGELLVRLRQVRPAQLYLRVDQSAAFGVAESVIMEAQRAGAVPYLAARAEK
jgi:hypothetical protein